MEAMNPNPLVSIILLAYGNLSHTKLCVESLFKDSSHIDFELITINNSFADGTEEFFNSLPNKKKISTAPSFGAGKEFNKGLALAEGEFLVFLSSALVLTPSWLDNLLKCIQSDERIGMAVPLYCYSPNSQEINLRYSNIEELYATAGKYNCSEPNKWEERLRLSACAFIARTELIKRLGGFDEIYNPYELDYDEMSFKIRRAGYKLILARDTYVHHFDLAAKQGSDLTSCFTKRDSKIFLSKFGVDACKDTNIDLDIQKLVDFNKVEAVDILGIGFRCGGTVLQIKNKFRENGVIDVRLWGLTEDEKYMADLKTVYDQVVCDRVSNIFDVYKDMKFDCILMDYELEDIEAPEIFLKRIPSIMKARGQVIFQISNELFYRNIINLLNGNQDSDDKETVNRYISFDRLIKIFQKYGYTHINYFMQKAELPEGYAPMLEKLKSISQMENKAVFTDLLCTRSFIFSAGNIRTAKKILLYPGYDFWQNNRAFEDKQFLNSLGVDVGNNFVCVLKDEFSKLGYEMSTINSPDDFDDAEFVIFDDLPKPFSNRFYTDIFHHVYKGKINFDEFLKKRAKGETKAKLVVRLGEPPFVMPENYGENAHEDFDIIFTYCDDLVDNKKYFKYFIPQPEKVDNPYIESFTSKKLLTFIGANKNSDVQGELYTERQNVIDYFEKYHIDDFDFYGKHWSSSEHKGYKGTVYNKLQVLSGYKFCIAYENGILNGWISEKIYDCFFARCIPIYWGAPNITDYIPANTFIDRRSFSNNDDLYDFISSMGEEKYNEYIKNIESFLASEEYKAFTRISYAKNLINVMLKQ